MKQLFLSLDFGRGANGESERYELLLSSDWLPCWNELEPYKDGLWQPMGEDGRERMSGNADRTCR